MSLSGPGALHLPASIRQIREDFTRFMLTYRFGMEQVATRVTVLREEFTQLHRDNPIEHVSTRIKSPDSIVEKVQRKGLTPSLSAISESITDIAGVRVTCSFVPDTYRVFDALTAPGDVTVREVKDYIAHPKPNGYRSLHAVVEVPVPLSSGPVLVPVELQLRTVAMDFWASLEHKIFYKYRGAVPADVVQRLTEAADTSTRLDEEMAALHARVHSQPDTAAGAGGEAAAGVAGEAAGGDAGGRDEDSQPDPLPAISEAVLEILARATGGTAGGSGDPAWDAAENSVRHLLRAPTRKPV